MANRRQLTLTDAEKKISYEITVTEEEYERAMRDTLFAQNLLHDAESAYNSCNDEDHTPPAGTSTCTWSYEKTMCLISSMSNHIEDLNHPKKRKHVYEMLSNDLISNGFTVTAATVYNKWKSLLRSYNKANDQMKRTGRGPARFLFFDKIDEIMGKKPTQTSEYAINSLDSESVDENSSFEKSADKETCKKRKSSEKLFKEELLQVKREKIKLEKEKLEIEKKKIELFEKFLNMQRK